MAETACLTPYPSKSMAAPSTRDLATFPNPSPLHSYVSSYSFTGAGSGSGPSPASKASLPLSSNGVATSSSNGITPCHNVTQGLPPSVYANGSSTPTHIHNANYCVNDGDGATGECDHESHAQGIKSVKASIITSNDKDAHSNGSLAVQADVAAPRRPSLWYEEEIDESLRWSFGLTSILFTGCSRFQEIALLDTEPFGKVLTLDRKMQSAEKDEWVYHECLVHPPLLLHACPKSIYVMGGGEGSTAREALRHRSVRKVVMCDIDEEVVKFCRSHLTCNAEAFQNSRLELVIDDAKTNLESRKECFDIIIGDLADPLEWGPCYLLYTKGFYESIVKPRLNPGGILVTQAGPAGILSHKVVFTSIYNTLKQVFKYVVAYSAHIPSYADTWGWVMASDQPFTQIAAINEIDCKIQQRIQGELRYLDGPTLHASTILNKAVRESLAKENHVYTEESARFIYGHGRNVGAH